MLQEQETFEQWFKKKTGREIHTTGFDRNGDMSSREFRLFDHGFFTYRAFEVFGVNAETVVIARTYLKKEELDEMGDVWEGLRIVRSPEDLNLGLGTTVILYPVAPGRGTDYYLQGALHLHAHMLNCVLSEEMSKDYLVGVDLVFEPKDPLFGQDKAVLIPRKLLTGAAK